MVHLTTLLCKAYRGGHLTIRLALGGCTNRPFYRIVAAHNKCPRDGRFVEQLGSYDPLPNSHGEKLVALNLDRIRHWIGCGAHLSKPMEKLLGKTDARFPEQGEERPEQHHFPEDLAPARGRGL
uniref:Isoform 2 of Small ribosomal subunit protein bS16m n=1 Tax=Homo sapiens TaxID=9606 RepID=Q9Y3D3-2|nr:unnamed protein product [Homo sapiens]